MVSCHMAVAIYHAALVPCHIAVALAQLALTHAHFEMNQLVTISPPVYCIPVYVQLLIAVQYPVPPPHPHVPVINIPLALVPRQG